VRLRELRRLILPAGSCRQDYFWQPRSGCQMACYVV
jgi:hypothetical protein